MPEGSKPSLDVTVSEAKAELGTLIARVRSGGQVTISEDGRAVARLVPADPPAFADFRGARGALAGKIWFAPDWEDDVYTDEELRAFGMAP